MTGMNFDATGSLSELAVLGVRTSGRSRFAMTDIDIIPI